MPESNPDRSSALSGGGASQRARERPRNGGLPLRLRGTRGSGPGLTTRAVCPFHPVWEEQAGWDERAGRTDGKLGVCSSRWQGSERAEGPGRPPPPRCTGGPADGTRRRPGTARRAWQRPHTRTHASASGRARDGAGLEPKPPPVGLKSGETTR